MRDFITINIDRQLMHGAFLLVDSAVFGVHNLPIRRSTVFIYNPRRTVPCDRLTVHGKGVGLFAEHKRDNITRLNRPVTNSRSGHGVERGEGGKAVINRRCICADFGIVRAVQKWVVNNLIAVCPFADDASNVAVRNGDLQFVNRRDGIFGGIDAKIYAS